MKKNLVLGGLFGVCIGDALGVPVEFLSREKLKQIPVDGMVGFGIHNQPKGTWSDDSSMAFCLAESLCLGYDIYDIADKFSQWLFESYWTPHGDVFDAGTTTRIALGHLKKVEHPSMAGGTGEHDNGNGSLMRILPIAFYVKNFDTKNKFKVISEVSSITHGHIRSIISCCIYVEILINLLKGKSKEEAYEDMKEVIINHFKHEEELEFFNRILEDNIASFSKEEIHSSGYVLDTLEASLWCFLNNDSYKETVLTAVNLGEDTDTTGAVAGGLAGIYYGFDKIPKEWIAVIARKEDITKLANKLNAVQK
jgi:ADP-ribosyl-[dinitrogen reductase] hydrolase